MVTSGWQWICLYGYTTTSIGRMSCCFTAAAVTNNQACEFLPLLFSSVPNFKHQTCHVSKDRIYRQNGWLWAELAALDCPSLGLVVAEHGHNVMMDCYSVQWSVYYFYDALWAALWAPSTECSPTSAAVRPRHRIHCQSC